MSRKAGMTWKQALSKHRSAKKQVYKYKCHFSRRTDVKNMVPQEAGYQSYSSGAASRVWYLKEGSRARKDTVGWNKKVT